MHDAHAQRVHIGHKHRLRACQDIQYLLQVWPTYSTFMYSKCKPLRFCSVVRIGSSHPTLACGWGWSQLGQQEGSLAFCTLKLCDAWVDHQGLLRSLHSQSSLLCNTKFIFWLASSLNQFATNAQAQCIRCWWEIQEPQISCCGAFKQVHWQPSF
jgi:hypothetical protein